MHYFQTKTFLSDAVSVKTQPEGREKPASPESWRPLFRAIHVATRFKISVFQTGWPVSTDERIQICYTNVFIKIKG